MAVANQIRRIYELRPFPALKGRALRGRRWCLPPMGWIDAVWQPAPAFPARILVAGCGTGAEAFALARRFPHAEIVAVDFSPRSVAIARDSQKRTAAMRRIRFVVGDLTGTQFAKTVGSGFEFVSCHGVLSYVTQPDRALRNLAGSLTPDGALCLGVNGAAHFSESWRRVLPALGFNMTDFEDSRRLREALRLCAALTGESLGWIAKINAGYLASDLFGPLIRNLPLTDWTRMCRKAGLHLLGSYFAHHSVRPALNCDLARLFIPHSRAEVCELLDSLRPSTFHPLVFSRRKPASPPWEKREIGNWHPTVTKLYRHRWPSRRGAWDALRRVRLESPSTNTLVELRMPEWGVEILRRSDGTRTLREILSGISPQPPRESLIRQLYALYLLAAINITSSPKAAYTN